MPKGQYVRGRFSYGEYTRGDLATQFWKRVDKFGPIHPIHGQCWVWLASKLPQGYGQFKGKRAHRVVYEICIGEIPEDIFVLHKCDNPSCVNPDHLFLGTPQDNMDDKMAKGRQGQSGTKTPPHGEKNGRAKLTREQVIKARELYSQGVSIDVIEKHISSPVHRNTIVAAISGRTWRNIL